MSAGACSRGAAFAGGRLGCARRTRGIERCRVRAGFRTAERAADFGRGTATLAAGGGGGGGVGDTAAADAKPSALNPRAASVASAIGRERGMATPAPRLIRIQPSSPQPSAPEGEELTHRTTPFRERHPM